MENKMNKDIIYLIKHSIKHPKEIYEIWSYVLFRIGED